MALQIIANLIRMTLYAPISKQMAWMRMIFALMQKGEPMDELTKKAGRMIEIVNDRRDFYRSFGDEICDIASAVYQLIIRLQVLEMDLRGEQDGKKAKT